MVSLKPIFNTNFQIRTSNSSRLHRGPYYNVAAERHLPFTPDQESVLGCKDS